MGCLLFEELIGIFLAQTLISGSNQTAPPNEYKIGNTMLIKKPADFRYSEITPKSAYLNRRKFLAGVPAAFLAGRELFSPRGTALAATLENVGKSPLSTTEKQNTLQEVTH